MFKIEAESCPGFVETVLEFYKAKKLFAVVRPETAQDDRLQNATSVTINNSQLSGWIEETLTPDVSDDPAQIVFSSGTEGRPKAIIISHRNLADVVERLNSTMQVTSEIREYVGVPVTYSFGLGRVRAVATAQGKSFIPEAFSPVELSQMLQRKEVNAFSVVPSLCRVVLKSKDLFKESGKNARWIEIGSQYMSADEKVEMRKLFPNARIIQHYGLTEASRSTFLDITNADISVLDSVGTIDGSVEVRINEEGAICLKGRNVAMGHLSSDGSIVPFTDQSGWLETKDKGEIRNNALYFLGRLDDQMNIAGIKLSAEKLEEQLREAIPAASGQFAITHTDDPMRGQLALLVGTAASHSQMPALADALKGVMAKFGVTSSDAFETFEVETLPVTGSGKVQRAKLRSLYKDQSKDRVDSADPTTISGIFKRNFPRAKITPETTFQNLGGDSLSYITVSLDLENVLGTLPDRWEEYSVAALEQHTREKGILGSIDTPTLLRATSICLVVLGHFGAWNYFGTAAFALFFIAGLNFSNLTVPAVLASERLAPALILLLRIAILTWCFMTINWLITGYGGPLSYLFITNWIDPHYPGSFWFIGAYIQLVLLLIIILSFPAARKAIAQRPFETCTAMTVALIGMMVLSEIFWDTNHLFRRLPHIYGFMFTCGMMIYFAATTLQKSLCLFLTILGFFIFSGMSFPGLRYEILAVAMLCFVTSVPIPRIAISTVRFVAGASLVIYLTHYAFRSALEVFVDAPPWSVSLVAIIGGVMAYRLYQPVDNAIRKHLQQLIKI